MILAMFSNFGGGTIAMILLAIVIGVYLYRLDKKEKSDPFATLYKQYETLSTETLSSLSDDEAVRAVAVNIMAKTDKRHPDVYALFPVLSHGRIAVYSIWLLCNELKTADLAAVMHSPSAVFVPHAADGLSLIGASDSAAALTAFLKSPDTTDAEAVTQSLQTDDPLSRCVAYIRDNPSEFVDL